MPKKLSEIKKKEMVDAFKKESTFDELVILYKLKVNTIKKHLKSLLSESEFKKIINFKKN